MATTPMSNHPKSWPENRQDSGRGPTTAWTLPGGGGGRSLVEGTWEVVGGRVEKEQILLCGQAGLPLFYFYSL